MTTVSRAVTFFGQVVSGEAPTPPLNRVLQGIDESHPSFQEFVNINQAQIQLSDGNIPQSVIFLSGTPTLPIALERDPVYGVYRGWDDEGRPFYLLKQVPILTPTSYEFLLNPSKVDFRFSKMKVKNFTLGGIEYQFFGNELAQLAISGVFPFAINRDGSLPEADAWYTSDFYLGFVGLRDWYESLASTSNNQVILVSILYQEEMFGVRLINFSHEEDASKPGVMSYTLSMVIEKFSGEDSLQDFYSQGTITNVETLARLP